MKRGASGLAAGVEVENGSRASLPSLRDYLARYPDRRWTQCSSAARSRRTTGGGSGVSGAQGKELELAYAR